ncbi:MAG TPA: hypothetical protein VKT72_12045 [Candidatus Baltobacteraceae bacterium]|nr:hypothetical protein [Candidatus Baltobacteraceae bacterium]
MPKVELERPLSVPAVPARAAASFITHAIEAQTDGWDEFALYLDFGALGLPDVGYVAVPITISNVREVLEPRHEIAFILKARRSPDAFPVFKGAIGIEATGPSLSQIWLGGDYELPMHALGGLINQVFARGAAEKTLDNMLRELADAIEAHVQQRERAHARYRLVFNTGD